MNIRALTLRDAAAALDTGDLDASAVDAGLRRDIAATNPDLHAYRHLTDPDAEAPHPVTSGPLAGLGVAIKANIAGRRWIADCGSRLLAGYRSPYDATVIERLDAAGAHVLGTTSMDEFGMGSSCEHVDGPSVRNPWHPRRTAGGSSGGSAAAVAAGLAWYALGSDTGGSVRLPAHCCGVVGLKPTWGRVSRYGLVAFASSLDTIGILARDVRDAALVYGTIAGHDPRDATSLRAEVGRPLAACDRDVTGLRLGVPRALLERELEPAQRADFARSLDELRELGLDLVDVGLPGAERAVATYTVLSCAEAASNLARFDGTAYGRRRDGADYDEMARRTRTAGFGREVKRRILLGNHVLAAGYREDFYLRARRARQRLGRSFAAAFANCDALVLPTAAGAAFPLGSRLDDPLAMYASDIFTVPASLAGLPALTLPTDLDPDGLPLSIQLIGPPLGEDVLLAVAAALEPVRAFRDRKEAPWRRPS